MPIYRPSIVGRRLVPLYAAAFLQSFVLWYVIEKLFMRSIGFTDATIGIMAAVYSGVMLLAETPSGILADRWSRKGVLILGSVALAISAWVCGVSSGVFVYIVGAMCWGVFYALYSGTYDSVIYDTLIEERGSADDFHKYYGRVRIAESLALVASSLLGGLLGDMLDLRAAFYWTVPFSLLSIVPLLIFREPRLHKAETETPVSQHVRGTFRAVLQKGALKQILLAVVGAAVATDILLEFTQLWYIAIAMPIALYGMANAFLLAAPGFAGVLAKWLNSRQRIDITLAVGFVASLGLLHFKHSWQIMILQTVLCLSLSCMSIALNKRMHDELPSKVRAGAASAISTLGRLLFIPLAALFGYVSNRWSIFMAGWIIAGVFMLMVVYSVRVFGRSQPTPEITT